MPGPEARPTLAELIGQDVRLEPDEAATIIREICSVAMSGAHRQGSAPLTPGKITIDDTGRVSVATGTSLSVSDLGGLLEVLLVTARRTGTNRVPGPLLLTMARAIGEVEGAPFTTLEELSTSLARFAIADRPRPLAGLLERLPPMEGDDPGPVESIASNPIAETEAVEPVPVDAIESTAIEAFEAAPVHTIEPPVAAVVDPGADSTPPPGTRRARLRPAWVVVVALVGLVGGGLAAVAVSGDQQLIDVLRSSPTVPIATTGSEESPLPSRPRSQSAAPSASTSPLPPRAAPVTRAPVTGTAPSSSPSPFLKSEDAGAEAVFSPSFGESAVFFHAEGPRGSALKRADTAADGHVLHLATIVDDGAKNYHVQVSPDGRSMAFDSDRDGVRGVYVAQPDGTDVRRVSGGGYAAVPRWAPDSGRLTFLRAEPGRDKVWNLWMLDVRSGDVTRLTSHSYGQVWAGSWFPDGRRIGYSHEDRFIVLELDSERSSSYPSPIEGRLVRTPAVSPDGRYVIFQVYRDGGWLLDLTDGSMRRVLDDPSAEEFTWSPDGSRVAFHSRRSGEWGLWVMSPRSSS